MPSTPQHPSGPPSEPAARQGVTERDRARAERTRAVRRQRLLALGAVALVATAVALVALSATTRAPRRHTGAVTPTTRRTTVTHGPRLPPSSFAVGLRVPRLVDTSRTVELPNGTAEPRTLLTYVRYPALGPSGGTDLRDAPAARTDGPFPLVVFGHGFALTPNVYASMLQSWARAGYVVAAPAFPLENANAPGGPDESDLANQPADMRFVIARMLAASSASSGPLAGLINPKQIAVAGHSDGGDTALAVAYDRYRRDPRVSAAIILSGAEMPGVEGVAFPRGSPPLIAVQGTADTVNPPHSTEAFFDAAQRPKYLLSLLGAEHLPPYSTQQPQLGIVERVTTAFLDGYLKREPAALRRLSSLHRVPNVASLISEP